MTSPTQRTLAALRGNGYLADVVEKNITIPVRFDAPGRARVFKRDLFGFVDVLAIGNETIAVQCTSGSNTSSRVRKIIEECAEQAKILLQAGWRIEVWGWKKYKKAVDRKFWRPRIEQVTLEDLHVDERRTA